MLSVFSRFTLTMKTINNVFQEEVSVVKKYNLFVGDDGVYDLVYDRNNSIDAPFSLLSLNVEIERAFFLASDTPFSLPCCY